jgi:L-ascorbate metabolism protein UlaG (beta-lactamase superfamily)
LDITWYGHSCFRITERGKLAIITDPFADSIGIPAPKLKGDIVTISHHSPGHNNVDAVKGSSQILVGPGEYEIGGVFITGIAMNNTNGESNVRENVAYLFDFDNLTVLHLGDLAHVPDQSTIEALGEVNVALVPVGGGNGMRAAEATEMIALLEPNYIVPMHYGMPGLAMELDPVDKFLKTMGVSKIIEEDSLRVTSGALPEQPQVVILRQQA